jgi:hypothetical protein
MIEKFSMSLNEFRKNLAALGNCSLRCSTTYIPVGDLDRSPLIHSYCYASAGDQSTLFASFSLIFVPFMQYAGFDRQTRAISAKIGE